MVEWIVGGCGRAVAGLVLTVRATLDFVPKASKANHDPRGAGCRHGDGIEIASGDYRRINYTYVIIADDAPPVPAQSQLNFPGVLRFIN
jgi:hypothetical protein